MKKILSLFFVVMMIFSHKVFALEKINVFQQRCGIENCHGLDIICGENVPEECTAIYKFGDRCRQYAKCGIVDGKCIFIESKEFSECKSCIQRCLTTFKDDAPASF